MPRTVMPDPKPEKLLWMNSQYIAAMPAEVPLAVAIEIQSAGENPPRNRLLPDRRPDRPALPRDVLGKSNIDRNDHAHHGTP